MINKTNTNIIIEMNHVDNAKRFKKALENFISKASTGGDSELYISKSGTPYFCGFVAHDLDVKSIKHVVKDTGKEIKQEMEGQ